MEGFHVNGVVESDTKDQPPTDTGIVGGQVNGHDKEEKDSIPVEREGAVEDQKQSFKFVLKTKTSVSSIEDEHENDKEVEKAHTYVIRSQTSVESYEDTKDNPKTPPSDAQLKFTVRTQSTEEHVASEEHGTRIENAVEENGPTTKDEVFNDNEGTQNEVEKEIAAKATEIVATILEKLENEEISINHPQEQKLDVESAQEDVVVTEAAVRQKQQLSEDKEDNAEVANVDAAPAAEAEPENKMVEEDEDRTEVLVMKFESNEEEDEIRENVDVQTEPEELPAAATAVLDLEEQLWIEDQQDKAEVASMKFERKEDKIDLEERVNLESASAAVEVQKEQQPSEGQEGKAELLPMEFKSKQEEAELEETSSVEEASREKSADFAVEEQQPPEDEEGNAELVAMKFKSREEDIEVEEKADVETVPEVSPAVVAQQEESQPVTEDQEGKAEVVTMKFESKEEEIEVEEKADVETVPEVSPAVVAPQEESQPATEDQEGKAEVVTMKFESKEEEIEVENNADVETVPEVLPAVVAPQQEPQPATEDQEGKREVVTMKFETNEEEIEVEEKADVETVPEVPPAVVAPQQEPQPATEDQEGKAEVVTMNFESKEEEIEVENNADVETVPEVSPAVVAQQEEPQPSIEDQEGKAEVVTMKFESKEEEIEVEEKAGVETVPEVSPAVVAPQEEPQPSVEDQEGKAEIVTTKFESKEENVEVEETAEVEGAPKEVPPAVALEEADQPSEHKESNAEVVAMKFESREEQIELDEKADVVAAQADSSAAADEVRTADGEEAKAEIDVLKFESSQESATREEIAFEEAKEPKVFVDAVKIGTEKSQHGEEPLSPKQEYVAESFLNKPQSQHEIQDDGGDDSEESEEKPIIKVRLPEEPFQTGLDDQDDDVVEVHGTEVDVEEIVTSPEFESQPAEVIEELIDGNHIGDVEENDSDGEIEVKIRRFSQENQELIHDESDDDESSPVDWMAKDDVDEVVFRGEAALSPTSLKANEPEPQKQIDQETCPTKTGDTHILVQSGGKIYVDDVVVPDTREVEVCSGLESMFAPEELREPEKAKPDDSVLDYDIDKEIEEERKRLTSEKKVATNGGINVEVHEEVLANEFRRKQVSDLDIKLMGEDDKGTEKPTEDEEEKPPSPLEAKEVKDRGIKEIFETETFRASGEFLSPVLEGDEYNTSAKDRNLTFERKSPVANEEALQASEQGKRCSLEWSLLDKWKEMELKAKRESLELEESKGETKIQSETIKETESEQPEAAVLALSETKENEPDVNEIRENDEPEVTVTKTTEITPSSVSKVTTTKTVTKTRIIKARTEVQPETENEILETPGKDEESQEEPQEIPESEKAEQEIRAPLEEPTSPMSTILFRMDGTPIVIPPEPQQDELEEKPVEEAPKEEQEPVPEEEGEKQADVAPMATILFKMDGTPVVIPAAPKTEEAHPPSPKPKSVVFSGVRPQSLASVESVRGEREGVPPLAGEEESDIDDSSLHLAKQATGASKAPTVSPVKEVASPEKGNQPPEGHEAESPLLDNSANRGQKCCVIL